jgi:hypothetical protein
VPERALQLAQGNVAVIGPTGLRAEINTWDPTGQAMLGDKQRAVLPAPKRLWLLWTVVTAFLAGVAGYGVWFWRRRMAAARS